MCFFSFSNENVYTFEPFFHLYLPPNFPKTHLLTHNYCAKLNEVVENPPYPKNREKAKITTHL